MDNEIVSKAKELIKLNEKKKWLEEELKNLKRDFAFKKILLFHIMFNEDIQNMTIEGMTIFRKVSSYPVIINEIEFFNWLRNNGFENLIKETVHPNTLKSWYKEFSEKNENVEEIFSYMLQIFEEGDIGIRKVIGIKGAK